LQRYDIFIERSKPFFIGFFGVYGVCKTSVEKRIEDKFINVLETFVERSGTKDLAESGTGVFTKLNDSASKNSAKATFYVLNTYPKKQGVKSLLPY